MPAMGTAVAFLIAQGWASGISVWGVLVATGIADRVGWVDAPGYLGSTTVFVLACVLLLIEVIADKVAFLDSASDTIQTLIRPVVGAAIASQYGGAGDELSAEVAAMVGGSTTMVSHLMKAGIRAVVNVSPEPVSNVLISSGEDVAGATVIGLAFHHPWVALILALSLFLLSVLLLLLAIRLVRRAIARLARYEPPPPSGPLQRFQQWVVGDRARLTG